MDSDPESKCHFRCEIECWNFRIGSSCSVEVEGLVSVNCLVAGTAPETGSDLVQVRINVQRKSLLSNAILS